MGDVGMHSKEPSRRPVRPAAHKKAPPGRGVRRRVSPISCLWRNRRGTAVIEFALIAPIFMYLVAGIIELSTMFFISVLLEGTTQDAAREVRTGQVQEAVDPLATFRARICGGLFDLVDCDAVVFSVQSYPDFASANLTIQLNQDGDPFDTTFAPGGSGGVTVVRVSYRWRFVTPLIGQLLSDNGTNSLLLLSTAAFQNEPFGPLT